MSETIEKYTCCDQPLFCDCKISDEHRGSESAPAIGSLACWKKENKEWYLYVEQRGPFATVYENGTWFTWDEEGVGGENSIAETIETAKKVAAASAIMQGFI